MPIREQSDKIYRKLAYGDLLDVFMIDTRLDGRMKQVQDVSQGASQASKDSLNDPDRTIMSPAQFAWLTSGLSTSTSTWRLIGNQVIFAPVEPNPIDTTFLYEQVGPLVAAFLRPQIPALQQLFDYAFKGDVWSNYPAQRARLTAYLRSNAVSKTAIVTGDFHTSFAFSGDWPSGQEPIVEFATPSITSANFDENLSSEPSIALLAPQLVATVEKTLAQNNRHIAFQNIVDHGYLIVNVTPDTLQGDWFLVDTLYTVSRNEQWAAGYWTTGEGRLTAAMKSATEKVLQDVPAPPDPPSVVGVEAETTASPLVILGYGPNPATTSMYVSFVCEHGGTVSYRLVDITGNVVASFTRQAFPGLNSTMIDLSRATSGRFLLEVSVGNKANISRLHSACRALRASRL